MTLRRYLTMMILCLSGLALAQPTIETTDDATLDEAIVDDIADEATVTVRPEDRYWFGLTTGFPLGAIFHIGITDVVGPIDLRASTSAGLGGPFDFGLSALIDLPVTIADWPTTVYAGGGPTFTVGYEDDSGLDLQGLLGIDYRLGGGAEPGEFFVELGPIVEIIPELDSSFVTKVGFNYYFDF